MAAALEVSWILNCNWTWPAMLRCQPLTCWTRFSPTWPASYATSRLAVERNSCGPDFRTTLLAALFLVALLLEAEWTRLGWNLEELLELGSSL